MPPSLHTPAQGLRREYFGWDTTYEEDEQVFFEAYTPVIWMDSIK